MTNKTKIIVISVLTLLGGTAIWLWWRQKDAVPPAAVPIMQQARAVLAGATASPGTTAAATPPDATQSILSSVVPGYIPLPS